MKKFNTLESNSAEINELIETMISSKHCALNLEIINFSFTSITYILEKMNDHQIFLIDLRLTVHHCTDSEKLYVEKMLSFAKALEKQTHLQHFRFELKIKSSLKFIDPLAYFITQGLMNKKSLDTLNLYGFVSDDKGTRNISALIRKVPSLIAIGLKENDIGDEGVSRLISAVHLSNVENLDLNGNHLTDQSIDFLISAPYECNITTLGNPITVTGNNLLGNHRHLKFFFRHADEKYYCCKTRKKMRIPKNSTLQALNKIIVTSPKFEYTSIEKSEFEFSQSLTPRLSLSQLLKGDSRMWEKPSEKDSLNKPASKILKDIIICAYSAILPNFLLSAFESSMVFYWQGDPHHFGKKADDKFVPATSAQVEELIERARPAEAHRYWVIDEEEYRNLIKDPRNNPETIRDFDFFYARKEVDLSFYAFFMTDDLFCRIATGLSKTTTAIELMDCYHLNPQTILEVLKLFPHLESLGLRQTQSWDLELNSLSQICPRLEDLEICIDTVEPLKNLEKFRRLQRLSLDLSDNLELRNLNFLKSFGHAVTELKFSGCTNLNDLSGLKYCPNLEEVWFEHMPLVNFNDLIITLGQLKKLQLWVFYKCEYSAGDEAINLIYKLLPEVYISTLDFCNFGKNLSKNLLTPVNQEVKTISTPKEMNQDFNLDPAKRQSEVSQIFWDSKGQWPDSRLDRFETLDLLQIKDDGHIVFTASPIEQHPLILCQDVKLTAYENINVSQLRSYESKDRDLGKSGHYYGAQLTMTVFTDQWTAIPSRGVYSKPLASSENLLWARSILTGELLVRLPEKTGQLRSQKILLRYMIVAFPQTLALDTGENQKLPDTIQDAFTALSKNEKILQHFPKFQQFIDDMRWLADDSTRYNRIKQYCQIDPLSGFTDAPFDDKLSKIVNEFIDTLPRQNIQTLLDLCALFNALLQQKGVCADLTRCAKLLCGYYDGIPCHILVNYSHAFLNYSYREEGDFITRSDDLGGGTGRITYHALEVQNTVTPEQIISKSPTEVKSVIPELIIAKTLAEFKAVTPIGEDCQNLHEYWQLVLSIPHPLICIPGPADAQKALAALRQYALQKINLTPQQLFYVNDPKQLTDDWETAHISKDQPKSVPGWLQQFLLDRGSRILVIDLQAFTSYDLTSHQGIGDQQRTLQNLVLPPHIQVICLAPQKIIHEDIFISRFTAVSYRGDLFSEVKPIRYLWPESAEKKSLGSPLNTLHLYGDSIHATDCLGVPKLEGDQLNFIPGPLTRALVEKHDLLLTDVPQSLHPLLFLSTFTGQSLVNGSLQPFPDIKIYEGVQEKPSHRYVQFMDELKSNTRRFYLNPHTFSLLVKGDRRIDPITGYSYSRPALLLSEELPEVIVVTRSLSYFDWCELISVINQLKKTVSFYLCPGVRIAAPNEDNNSKNIVLIEELKTLPPRSSVIETATPETSFSELQKHSEVDANDVLTLTPQVGLELLMLISRKGERFLLNYQPGWLLSRLRTGQTTVLIGEMSSVLYYALESLFTESPHLYTNEGLETFSGRVIWITSSEKTRTFPNVVSRYQHHLELKPAHTEKEIKEEKTVLSESSYRDKVKQIADFIKDNHPRAVFLELLGPPGSGKTTAVTQAIRDVRGKESSSIEHFVTVDGYIVWRNLHPDETTTVCVLQLDDCRMSPPGQLEFLRDMARKNQFYWQGVWYPGLKVIMTNNPESDLHHEKHPLFKDQAIPSLTFTAFTSKEMKEYILQSPLEEINELIVTAYQYIANSLPYVCISARELTMVCQRLAVLQRLYPTKKPAWVCARACYEEFFGLFTDENHRLAFWSYLQESADLNDEAVLNPIVVDSTLKAALQKQGLQMTAQAEQMVTMVQRLLQMREQHDLKDPVGKGGLLFEGPPGLLKTELSIAVLEAQGVPYLNLVAGDPVLMEKQLRQAYAVGLMVICNELNLLKPETIQLLMTLLEAPDTRFRLIATQNRASTGGGRKPLLPALRNRLQVFYLRDYNSHELTWFAKNQGLQEGARLAEMFLALRDYQIQYRQAVANPRHYFRWLAELVKRAPRERSLAWTVQSLLKIACHPLLNSHKAAKPGQRHAVDYILHQISAKNLPKVPSVLSGADKITLIKPPQQKSELDLKPAKPAFFIS